MQNGSSRRSAPVWAYRMRAAPASPPQTTTAEQLGTLAELRERDAITPEEYESAKSQLLHR